MTAMSSDLVISPRRSEDVDLAPLAVRRLARWRVTVVALGVAMSSLPLLRPSGPGNTGLVDLALLAAMLTTVHLASAQKLRLRFPYAVPAALTVVAGGTAVLMAQTGSTAVTRSALALLQDLFVFGWAASIATVGQDRRVLRVMFHAFAFSALAWAIVLIVGELLGISWITGITARDGVRASLTFGDPNLAADYFICGLFVLRACQVPRRRGLRFLCCTLIVTAIVLTLSNGGILALTVATVLGGLFALARRRGLVAAMTVGLAIVLVAGVAIKTVNIRGWVSSVEQSDTLIRDSLGREAESSGSRSALASESIHLWMHSTSMFGYGPANTEAQLRRTGAAYVKEAHDDYMATLLERGIVGGLALVILMALVAVRARRIAGPGGLSPELRDIVPRPELLGAACIALAMSAMFYEVLHFRHVWAVLGLVAALAQTRSTANDSHGL